MKNRNAMFKTILLVLVCFALLPKTQAVVPAPDGGYGPPAYGVGNTAEGQDALFSLTTGTYNTAVGLLSLRSNTGGSLNTAIGAGALISNDNGVENTATGAGALFSIVGGDFFGRFNTANGAFALFSNTTGDSNTATGCNALLSNTTGIANTANGFNALRANTIANANTAVGDNALLINTTGGFNTAVGDFALSSNITGDFNTALGNGAGGNVTAADNVICIGAAVGGANVSNSCYIGNIWNQPGGSQAVYVNSEGKLGALVSSRRFKDEIKPMEQASEVIYGLNPVSFRYKAVIEPTRPRSFGLVAEDVEKINPDLVTRGNDGKVNSVRYDQVNAMLLNEFLKEHRTVQRLKSTVAKQEATIAQQRKDFEANAAQQQTEIQALTASFKEQELQIKKVSAQLEVRRPAPQVACVRAIPLREDNNNP